MSWDTCERCPATSQQVSEGGLELLTSAKHLDTYRCPDLRLRVPSQNANGPRICIQLPPNAPPAVSRGYHERGPGLRGTSSGTTSLAVVSSSPQGHETTTS